jgi:2-haloacid dehalogenase
MTAQQHNVDLSEDDRATIMGTIRSLPAHPDIVPGLEKLKSAGFRLVTLTNSPPLVVEAQLKSSNLTDYFEASFSVDSVKLFKPAAEVYQMTAKELDIKTEEMRMVAAHDWDVVGALNAGCAAAFIARPGKVLNPLLPKPDIVGVDLIEVADEIIQIET